MVFQTQTWALEGSRVTEYPVKHPPHSPLPPPLSFFLSSDKWPQHELFISCLEKWTLPSLHTTRASPPHVSKCDNSLICQEQRRVRRPCLWENFGSRTTDARQPHLPRPVHLFLFFSPFAFFFVSKAPFVKFSYVIVVTFKPEKVSCLMANSIQFYYPQEYTEVFFSILLV